MCGCIIRDYIPSSTMDSVHIEDSLQNKAFLDPLTGALNRFHFQMNEKEYSNQNNIGVADFAHKLRETYKNAFIYRMGGDEFVVITNNYDYETFSKICSSTYDELSTNKLSAMGYKFFEHTSDIWNAVDECDKLMYEHKCAQKSSL